ncbi:MAG: hypothetical protein R6W82_03630 [bacterium]
MSALRPALTVPAAVLFLAGTGCDYLLGPAAPVRGTAGPDWSLTEVTAGTIAGLDIGITLTGEVYASYVHDGSRLRVSRLDGGAWTHMEGPTLSGPDSEDYTRLAVDPEGGGSVLYRDGGSLLVADLDTGIGPPEDLAAVEAVMRTGSEPRPAGWTRETSSAAYGDDGVLRVVARAVDQDRLWLFRRSTEGWDLGPVPGSEFVHGSSEIAVSAGGVEHVLFAANSQGIYYWYRPGRGWASRLDIPDGQPYLIRIDGSGSSVLATRDRFRVRVAAEEQDPQSGLPFWNVRTVVEDDHLFWHTLGLVLDEEGLPGVLYVLGPLPREDFEVWFRRLTPAGWESSLVAGNLRLPVFNPFDVRMVRDPGGTVHVLLPAEGPTETDGSAHRLIHLRRDPDGGP